MQDIEGLRIVGEIQIQDEELFQLKQKVLVVRGGVWESVTVMRAFTSARVVLCWHDSSDVHWHTPNT